MPRTIGLTETQKIEEQCKKVAAKVDHMRLDKRITYRKIGEMLGISAQAVSQQFHRRKISMEVVFAVCYLADAQPEEIGKMMRVQR